jgi:hypothetical protein
MGLVQFDANDVKSARACGRSIATLVAAALLLTLAVMATPASAQKGLLQNWSLGETVIYCDNSGELHAAMIIKVRSETVVDLEAIEYDGSRIIVRDVNWNDTLRDRPNSWWRRIKT